jgi:hypothetical protein
VIKKFIYLFFILYITTISFSQLFIENIMPTNNRPLAIPIGTEDVVLFRFSVSSDIIDTWETLVIKKNTTFNSGWFEVKIYQDYVADGIVDSQEKNNYLLNNRINDEYGNTSITINNIMQDFEANTKKDFLLTVTVFPSANIGTSLHLSPNIFLARTGMAGIISTNITAHSFDLSRLYSHTETSITNNYYINDSELELFHAQLKLVNDTRCWVTFNLSITHNLLENNIGELRIYRENNFISSFDINNNNVMNISLPQEANNRVDTTSKNFYIRYYNNNIEHIGASIDIKLNYIIGYHDDSRTKGFSYISLEEASVKNIVIPGVEYSIENIMADNNFIGGVIDVFDVTLNSFYEDVVINTIELSVTGNFIFSNTNSFNIIQNVLIKNATNTTITVSIGNYIFKNDDTIIVTINQNLSDDSLLNLQISYTLTSNITEQANLQTKINNITYTYPDNIVRDFSNIFATQAYSNYPFRGEAIVRMSAHFITSDHKTNFPRGGTEQKIAYMHFTYNGVPDFDTMVRVDTFTIKNNGTLPINFLDFYLVYDSNNNYNFDASDLIISERLKKEFDVTNNILTINNSQIIIENDVAKNGYFLVMAISPSANTGLENISLEIPEILYYREFKEPTDVSRKVIFEDFTENSITISVTGLLMEQEKRDFILPYRTEESFVLATFSIISLVRLTEQLNFNIEIKTNTLQSLGTLNIVKNYLGIEKEDYNIVTINPITNLNSTIIDPESYALTASDNNEITRNYKIIYHPDKTIPAGTTFDVIISNINGLGYLHGYNTKCFSDNLTINIGLSGIEPSFNSVRLLPSNKYIGGNLDIFNITLNAFYQDITLKTIEFSATGDFVFSNTNSYNIIQNILIKNATNNTITVSVGNYIFKDDDTIIITVNQNISNNSLLNLQISYTLTSNITEQANLQTKINNITYTYPDNIVRDFSNIFANEAYSNYPFRGEAIVRMSAHFITSDHKINFPRGGTEQKIAYMHFTYNGVPDFDTMVRVDTFTIKNNGNLPINFLDFYLVYDSNNNYNFDASDLIISERLKKEFDVTNNILTINNSQIIIENDVAKNGYFLVMAISPSANAGLENISLEIPEVLYYREFKEPTDISRKVIFEDFTENSITISVTGLLMEQEKRDFILPYRTEESFVLATFSIIALTRLNPSLNFDLEIKSNTNQNFGTLNIVKNYLGLVKDDYNVVTINNTSPRVVNINDSDSFGLTTPDHNQITRNYKIIYYPNMQRMAGITFDIIIRNIVGSGYLHGYDTRCFSDNLTINIGLSGLQVTFDSAVLNGTFKEMMEIPIYRLEYKSFFDNVTFNGVDFYIENDTFLFTNDLNENRIRKIRLYEDSNSNNVWDNEDIFLEEILPNYQHIDNLFITLNELVISGSSNNNIFLLFELRTYSDSLPLTAITSIRDYSYNHSGNSTIITVNQSLVQSIILEEYDYIFHPNQVLFTTYNFEGSYDNPILSFQLNSYQNTNTSYNIELLTNRNLYRDDDLGIKRITLIEDVDNDGSFNSKDIIIDVISEFSEIGNIVTLNIKNVISSPKYYLILFDFGQNMLENPNIDYETILRPQLQLANASSIKTVGLFPYPRNNKYLGFVSENLQVQLISITPNKWTTGTTSIRFNIININSEKITINAIYPQFYEKDIASLNVTYLYNITPTINFPITLSALQQKDIGFIISTDQEFKRDRLFLDALVEYKINNQKVRLQRKNIFNWINLLTTNETIDVDLDEHKIFYLDYPNYIQKIIRTESNLSFYNDDIIGINEHLLIHLKDTFRNFDTSKITLLLNDTTINMLSNETTFRYDPENNTILVGTFPKGFHQLRIQLYDNAGNLFPVMNINFSVYDSNQFYIKDLLVYPSKKSVESFEADTMKIGFQLSKSCLVKLYLFNSRGELVWNYEYNAIINRDHYQIVNFDGTLNNNKTISKGMYILKAFIIENGKEKDEKTTTRFIIF